MSGDPDRHGDELSELEVETVDGVPVLAEVRALERPSAGVLPAAQAVALAATSFVAGVATLALVRRHGARKELQRIARRAPRRGRGAEALEVVASQRLLVDIHLLHKPTR